MDKVFKHGLKLELCRSVNLQPVWFCKHRGIDVLNVNMVVMTTLHWEDGVT